MDPRFPRLDAAGHVYSGAGTLWRDGVLIGPGYGPVPIGVDRIVYGRDTGGDVWEGVVQDVATGDRRTITPWHFHFLCGSDAEAWVGTVAGGASTFFARDTAVRVIDGVSAPKLSRSAARYAWLTNPQDVRKTLVVNDQSIVTDDIYDMSVSDQAVCWDVARGRERHVFGKRHGDAAIAQWNIEPWEGGTLIDAPEGPWLLSVTQTGLILRPAGERRGYRFEGDCHESDARWVDGAIHIVGRNGAELVHHVVPLDRPRVDLTVPTPDPQPEPEPDPEPIVSIPDYLSTVQDLAARYPVEFKEAHRPELGDDRAYAFIRRLAWTLYQRDLRIGLCWKRGTGPLGWDSLTVLDGTETAPGSRVVAVIDAIGGAGGNNPTPAWNSGEIAGATWVQPEPVGDTGGGGGGGVIVPPPPPPSGLTAAQVQAIVEAVVDAKLREHERIMAGPIAEIAGKVSMILDLAQQQETRREQLAIQANEALIARTTTWPAELSGRVLGASLTLRGKVGK